MAETMLLLWGKNDDGMINCIREQQPCVSAVYAHPAPGFSSTACCPLTPPRIFRFPCLAVLCRCLAGQLGCRLNSHGSTPSSKSQSQGKIDDDEVRRVRKQRRGGCCKLRVRRNTGSEIQNPPKSSDPRNVLAHLVPKDPTRNRASPLVSGRLCTRIRYLAVKYFPEW